MVNTGDKKIKVPFAKPTFPRSLIRKYKSLVEEILTSGRLTLGKFTRLFEEKLAMFLGVSREAVVAMSSCTAALHAIMMSLKLKPGDNVLVPTYTFASTVNAPIYVNAKPILVDSDLDTFNILVEDVLEKVTRKTKAIIAVHIGGNPNDMKVLEEIAEDYKVYLIEDAAHALGSYYDGIPCGRMGQLAAFSFYPNKVITTGEGGAAVAKERKVAKLLRLIRCVGRDGIGPTEVTVLGHNFRMSELQAALGVLQLEIISDILRTRKKIADYYTRELKKIKGIYPQKITPKGRSSYYAYIIKVNEEEIGISRDSLRRTLLKKHGIETSILYKPVHLHKYYREVLGEKSIKNLRNAEFLGRTTLALPIYGHMKIREAQYVVRALKAIIEENS